MQNKEKHTLKEEFKHTSTSDIIHFIKRNDMLLSEQEKDNIWASISNKTVNSKRRFVLRSMSIAASLLVLVIGGWALSQYINSDKNIYSKLAAQIDLNKLHTTRLYINEQEIELNEEVTIACNSEKSQLQITNQDGSSFAISVPDTNENPLLQIAVPHGKKATIFLADKSEMTIRENSKVVFPIAYTNEAREVYLEGEAFLHVTKNPHQQFNVKTSQLNVSVLGTSFNVSASPANPQQSVVLVTGKVNVTSQSGESITMKPNQKFTYNKNLNRNTLTDIEPYDDICWTEDIIILNNEPLSVVFEKICKHYNTNLTYSKNEMSKIRISGKLDVTLPLKELLDMITKISPTHISINNKTIKINTNPNQQ